MKTNKKDFTKASEDAVNKFFTSQSESEEKKIYNTKHTHVTNKSKHYDERGKRKERFGLLMDSQLREDLKNLCNATGSKSLNDYIVSLLISHTELPENKKLLKLYSEIRS